MPPPGPGFWHQSAPGSAVDFGPLLCLFLTVGTKTYTGVTCYTPSCPPCTHLFSIKVYLDDLHTDYHVIWSNIIGNINCIDKAFSTTYVFYYIDMKVLSIKIIQICGMLIRGTD